MASQISPPNRVMRKSSALRIAERNIHGEAVSPRPVGPTTNPRLYLSPPHLGDCEFDFVRDAFNTNWIAPIGPNIDAFEREFAAYVGVEHAVAVTSGTAALHLSLRLAGVGEGDEVMVSTLTFCASVNPILYQGATPVFIDSERRSWNLDPDLLEVELRRRAAIGRLPKALVLVHLYGQTANIDPIAALCAQYDVILIEDAAEALGAWHWSNGESLLQAAGLMMGDGGSMEVTPAIRDFRPSSSPRSPGTVGLAGIFSFNGNKIITTSGGGMLVTNDGDFAARARKLATQARDDAPHYEHSQIGYNYRMSNVLAGIGRGQLQVLDDRVAARRRVFDLYRESLGRLPGIEFMPEASWGIHTRWLTCITIDDQAFGASRETVRLALEEENIESRPVWKPMHMQPVYAEYPAVGGCVAEELFSTGLCLPSGSDLTDEDIARVVGVIRRCSSR